MNYTIENSHCKRIEKVLIIEDSRLLLESIKNDIKENIGIVCDTAECEKSAKELLENNHYDLVIADIYLPDSSGNFIAYLVRSKYPLIVMTGSNNEEQRQKIVSLPIVDYVYKTDERSIKRYITNTIKRLISNKDILIVICDDSKLSRVQVKNLLVKQNLAFIELENGQEAYNCIMYSDLDIDLLITDVNMPVMGGIELIRKIRHEKDSYELPILSFSTSLETSLVAQLLKTGANDYITKPINNEEFLTRLNISLEQSKLLNENKKMIEELQKISTTDHLTTLYNRNYFYDILPRLQAQAKRDKNFYGIIMIDIDHFKSVNDNYGHQTGDKVLQDISKTILNVSRESDIAFRWGGEEFIILISNTSIEELSRFAQRIRKSIEHEPVKSDDGVITINVTVSCGVAVTNETNIDNVDNVISIADDRLYKAKELGRNRVVYE